MIREGSEVRWDRSGSGQGTVKRVFCDEVEIEVNGTKVKRSASKDRPAYLIEQVDGREIIKYSNEVYTVH